MRRLLAVLAGGLIGYLAIGVAMWGGQSRLIFEPIRELHAAPSDFSFPIVDVTIPLASGSRLDGWWLPAVSPGAKVVLYLHGNQENVTTSVREILPLRELGYAVLLIDYRGFGRSEGGFPSEAAVYEDAEAAWNYLVRERHVDAVALYIYGHSLGGAIAIELATRHPETAGLIVESSFTSIYDMARLKKRYALLPMDLFLNQRFDSIGKVGELKVPVLYLHGTDDEVVPFAMGQRLFEASGSRASLVAITGGRHDHDAAGAEVIRSAERSFVGGGTLAALVP
jgi:pimeloyl-ACP methyl ester carboxylesterase